MVYNVHEAAIANYLLLANSKRPFMLLLREIIKRNAQFSRSISNVLVVSGHQVSCLVSWDKFYVAHESLGPF